MSANNRVSEDYIEELIKRNWNKIICMLNKKTNRYLKENNYEYITGEKILYLGEYYEIVIVEDVLEKILLKEKIFIFVNNTNDKKRIKKILDEWYLKEVDYVLKDSLNRNFGLIEKYTGIYPELKYRKMTASWGNCRMPSGIITLNKNLIKAPIECIDYVMVHELVHLIHQNHSCEFYNLLEKVMPDWRNRKNILEYKIN